MEAQNIGFHIMAWEFVVCVLLMLASEKIGHYVGVPFGRFRDAAARYTRLTIFTFAAVWGLLIASLLTAFGLTIYFSKSTF